MKLHELVLSPMNCISYRRKKTVLIHFLNFLLKNALLQQYFLTHDNENSLQNEQSLA